MRGGKKCPLCRGPMSRDSRFCTTCSRKFAAWLCKVHGRPVRFIKPRTATGGRRAVGVQSRRRTLIALRNNGPSTAAKLAQIVGMTDQGVREQLNIMRGTKEVTRSKEGHKYVWEAR